MEIDLLKGLNPSQREAVTHTQGPLLVLAGPGSGKTRVITHRVAYLITQESIPPHRILAVTFTNKAADEMYRRLEALVPGARPFVATFHKFCARVLRQYGTSIGLSKHFTILDQQDRHRLLSEVMKELKIDTVHVPPASIERRISQLKNELVSPDQFSERDLDVYDTQVAKVYPLYQQRLGEQDAADFDDLLYHVAQLLRTDAEVRSKLDNRFQYVLVDEYQDTNLAQYAIARGLSVEHPHLCATGDPDQSIYSWRGADLKNILQFEKDFPGAHCVRLEQNYRSTGHILAAADQLIRFNYNRKHKELLTDKGPGQKVNICCFKDDSAEASQVANQILSAVDRGERNFRDFAILVRVNSLTRTAEAALRARHIPHQIVGGMSFFERKEIRDVLAYGRLVANPRDDSAFLRIINVPARGIGKTTIGRLVNYGRDRGIPLSELCRDADRVPGIRGKPAVALRDFRMLLDELQKAATMPPADAMEWILDRTEYREHLNKQSSDEADESLQHIDDMLAGTQSYQFQNPESDFVEFLETVSLSSDSDQRDDNSDLVTIMTLHAAKGLEFPAVFLLAFEQDILPHQRAVEEENIEEERRLLFVGITRAQEQLQISYCLRRFYQGRSMIPSPSPFLSELPVEALQREDIVSVTKMLDAEQDHTDDYGGGDFYEEPSIQIVRGDASAEASDRFRMGMLVEHPRYGTGQILQIEGSGDRRSATVQFYSVGTRTFRLSHAPLQPVT